MNSFARFMFRYVAGVLCGLLLIAGIFWWALQPSKPRYRAPSPAAVSKISNEELQALIADVYHVQTSRFVQPDLMWITLPMGQEPQKTCQAIANLWAHRSGLDYVRVECWAGNTRLGQGTVMSGEIRTP